MKQWMLLAALLLAVPVAHADEATKTAKLKDLFRTIHMERAMASVNARVIAQIDQMLNSRAEGKPLTDAQKKVVEEYRAKMDAETKVSLNWAAVEPEYLKLYAATFSEQELDAILVFYKSPAGQVMLEKSPELTQGGLKIVQDRIVAFQPKMTALQQEFAKALMAASPAPTETKPAAH